MTKLCTQTDRIDSRDYGSKGALVGTWDLTKVCAANLLDHWNDTVHPANKAVSVTGEARARWVFTDTTVQRTVSWEITQTFKITKIQQNETCEQNAARYTKALAQDTSPTNPRYDVRGRPVTCKAAASGDTFYACTCDVSFSSVSVDGERFTDATPVGYLISSSGVTTGDRTLRFKSDVASLTTNGEGLFMVLTKK